MRIPQSSMLRSVLALAGLLGAATAWATDDAPFAKVIAVSGTATAERPGEAPRVLHCGDPVYAGERVKTAAEAKVDLLGGASFAALDGAGVVDLSRTGSGTPAYDLLQGHLRVVDDDGSKPAQIATPGLVAERSGRDTEALVVPEKAWTVSLICPYDAPLASHRRDRATETIEPGPGQCAVAKPREPLYLAPASHPRIQLASDQCPAPLPLAKNVTDRFGSPADVAAGPPGATSFAPPIGSNLDPQTIRTFSDSPGFDRNRRVLGVNPLPPVGPP
jgi:hypothetical protein